MTIPPPGDDMTLAHEFVTSVPDGLLSERARQLRIRLHRRLRNGETLRLSAEERALVQLSLRTAEAQQEHRRLREPMLRDLTDG